MNQHIKEFNVKITEMINRLNEIGFSGFDNWLNSLLTDLLELDRLINQAEKYKQYHKINPDILDYLINMDNKFHKLNDVLYSYGIDIIDFEIYNHCFNMLLKDSFDDITNDYVFSFIYEFGCCKERTMDITWEDGEFIIKDQASLIEYLTKYIYSE